VSGMEAGVLQIECTLINFMICTFNTIVYTQLNNYSLVSLYLLKYIWTFQIFSDVKTVMELF
jgi:hypothetical protein